MRRFRYGRILLVAGVCLLSSSPLAVAVSFNDPFYDWGLEWYRIVRSPAQPSGGILPIPDSPEHRGAPRIRAASWSIDGLHSDRFTEVEQGDGFHFVRFIGEEEADGLRLQQGGSTRLVLDGSIPFPAGFGANLAGRAVYGEARPHGGQWLERNLSWRSNGLEVLAGLTRSFWGDGSEGSLLLGHTAPPLEMVRLRTVRPFVVPATRSIARFHGSIFLAYLEERDRTIPFPLLQGTRMEWEPSRFLRLSATRTIVLGGAGRTEKLTLPDLWNIWLGRNENIVGPRDYRDTDQKASFGLELRLPPTRETPSWFDGTRFFYEYAGEDAFHGLLPTAVAHLWGGSLGFAGWLVLAEFAETVDDANWWYTNHTVYGSDSYFYRGYVMGHPMGPNGLSGHVRFWTPPFGSARAQAWVRARGHYNHDTRRTETWDESLGIRIVRDLPQLRSFETGVELARTVPAGGRGPNSPLRFRATMALRIGGGFDTTR